MTEQWSFEVTVKNVTNTGAAARNFHFICLGWGGGGGDSRHGAGKMGGGSAHKTLVLGFNLTIH